MKRLTAFVASMFLALALAVPVLGDFDPDENYMAKMLDAVAIGDEEAGYAAEQSRNEKIETLDLEWSPISFEDLLLLSKIMYAEAGSCWLGDEWRLNVGEVVLNRVESPEFPETIREVLEQPGQYYGKNSTYFARLNPGRECAELALRLLEGERNMEPSVVFQANFRQGGGTYLTMTDTQLGSTYFCYSIRPHLYEG